jgi:hypothetical protein
MEYSPPRSCTTVPRRLVDGAELRLEAVELRPQRRRVALREGVAA